MRKYMITLLLTLSLYGSYTEVPGTSQLKILSPEFSEAVTKRIILENHLQAYLVSDPKLQKSGAALVVNVGSWNEPVDHPGLAHFLEHMLFMGTKKYPQESEYDRYLNDHGGMTNAFTADDITAYMFTVDHGYFTGALDRFSQFFKEPLFDASGVSRELKAIDQEYSKNLNEDDIREYYILKSLGNTDHPFSRFGMGNIESLKSSTREDLIAWYNTHYSADLMHLIIYSSMPMDKLTELVEAQFDDIPQKPHQIDSITNEAFSDTLKGKLLKVRPLKSLQSITITWELPKKFIDMEDTRPQTLVAAVIGEEGPGSLLAVLKEERLAEGLSSGVMSLGSSSLMFIINIDLTNQGAENPNLVIERVFQEIALLKSKEIPEHVFQDIQQLEKIKYQLQSRKDLFAQLMEQSLIITDEPLASFPEKSYIIQSYSPKDVEELVQLLTPQNAVYTLEIPHFENPEIQKEKWLGGEYTIEPISEELFQRWSHVEINHKLHFPPKNQFIPKKLTARNVKPAEFPTPILVLDNDYGKVYYAADPLYKVPKVSMTFNLHTPKISFKNPRSIVLADYYVKAATDLLNEITYPASQAGLIFKIQRDDDAIVLQLDGFDEKAVPLMMTVTEALKNLSVNENQFDQIQKELERNYQNAARESPLKQGFEIFKSAVYKNFPTDLQKYAASQKILLKHFKLFTKHLFNQLYIKGMVFGNISENEAKEITEKMTSMLGKAPYPVSEQTSPEVISLLDQEEPLIIDRKINIEGNAAILAIDNGRLTPETRAVQQIMNRAMTEPFFAELRTKQQTGYLVFNSPEELEKNLFTIFAVQSTTHSARDLIARYELFIESFLQGLSQGELTKERFDNIKDSFIIQLKQRPKSYSEMGALLEKIAFDYDGDFHWLEKRIKAFEDLTYEKFIDEVKATLGKRNKGRLAITVTGNQTEPNLINYRTVRNLKFLHNR